MPPLLSDFIHNRVCKPKYEKLLTRPGNHIIRCYPKNKETSLIKGTFDLLVDPDNIYTLVSTLAIESISLPNRAI